MRITGSAATPLLYILTTGFAVLAVTAFATLAAQRARIASSLVLVFAGAVLAFVPGIPKITLDSELVLLLLLPPLLYSSGVGMSWRGFKKNLQPIMMLAIGCVLFTATLVAAASHWLLGLPWAVGFVLGAIVSPPDAVAPMAIARRLSIPRSLLVTLEGEGLVNDATALILFSFSLAAVAEIHFSLFSALSSFAVIVVAELVWGVLVGWASLWLRFGARNPEVEMVFSLLTPYAAFWVPHALGGSGVLAAVATGLFVSWNGPRFIPAATRLQGFFVWGLVVHIVEGVVFALTGLQAHVITEGLDEQGWRRLAFAGVLISAVVILVRFMWVFPATYLPYWLVPKARQKAQPPPWQYPFMIGFTGIRGVVSLAAALSIPFMIGDDPFPERSLVLSVTFFVIIVSLFGQGTTLPRVIRWLGLEKIGAQEAADAKRTELAARISGIDSVLVRLEPLDADSPAGRIVTELRHRHQHRRTRYVAAFEGELSSEAIALEAALELDLVEAERANLAELYLNAAISDEARRRIERELDLEDALVRHAAQSASAGMPDALG
jgi:Na+/H+ antiporter